MTSTRLASPHDLPRLADLLGELFALEHEFAPDRTAQMRGLAMVLDLGEAARIVVAEKGGRPVGMAVLHYMVSTHLGRRVALLEDVVVARSERGRGVGRHLMAAVIETARADGAHRITLLTDPDNTAARTFYESFGFARSGMVAYRRMLERSLTA